MRFAIGGAAFVLSIAFVPYISDAATAPRWALLAILVPVACAYLGSLDRPPKLAPLPLWLGGLFLAWAAVSALWTHGPYEAVRDAGELAILAGLFWVGGSLSSLKPIFVGLGFGMALNSAIVVAQTSWVPAALSLPPTWPIPEIASPGGLFLSNNFVAEPAAMVIVGLLAYRLWWLAVLSAPCVLATGARGALAGLAIAGIVCVWRRSRLFAILAMVGLAFAGLYAFAGRAPLSSIQQRLDIWQDTIAGLTFWGRGIGSFYNDFASHATHQNLLWTRPAQAHNDFLQIAYEFGVPGLILFLALCVAAMRQGIERLVLVVFFVEACFGFPFHVPVTAALAAVTAGHLCRVWVPVRRVIDGRGSRIRPWPQGYLTGGRVEAFGHSPQPVPV